MSPEHLLLGLRALIAVALYGFLAAGLLFLWRDLKEASSPRERIPEAHLERSTGEELPKALSLALVNLFGRAADNTHRLEDATISARHARLSYQGGQWWLEDLGSRNGTGVNELTVESPMVVTYGDEIRFGRVVYRLVAGRAPEPTKADKHEA